MYFYRMNILNNQKPFLFSTAYFPPISFTLAMLLSRDAMIEAHETYQKQTYRNRCYILSASGKQRLTIPVEKTFGNHTLVKDIQIAYHENWPLLHLRTIEAAYNASPFFQYYSNYFEALYSRKVKYLIDWNAEAISLIAKLLKAPLSIHYTTGFEKKPLEMVDLRNTFSPKKLEPLYDVKPYYQVFGDRITFQPDLSIIDLLFNLGPEAMNYLNTK